MSRLASSTASTSARTFVCQSRWHLQGGSRAMHHAATVTSPPPTFEEFLDSNAKGGARGVNPGLLPVRVRRMASGLQKVQELERKVEALEDAIKADSLAFNPLSYTEDELLAMYEDVLTVSVPQRPISDNEAALATVQKAREEEDRRVIQALEHRLCGNILQDGLPYRRILTRANEILSRAEAARRAVDTIPDSLPRRPLPMGVLSVGECEALVRVTLRAKDGRAAEVALEIMKKDHMTLPEESVTNILRLYSDAGDMQAADNLLANFLTSAPTEGQRHLHIRAHLRGTPLNTLPASALEVLHNYENSNLPAPIQTYTSVITSLFSRPSSLARAQGWDIFTHMRYVAHPTPDVLLYTLMIRACASPVTTRYSSEPEKALDLWTEMTVDENITPTVGAYNAVILACARSGSKTYVNEAFRLARQMLDSHRDAHGYSPFRPDKKTFCALLEGTKRIGDLGRARWILAEMVKGKSDGVNTVEAEIDEEVMMHIFHAYASYKVPVLRAPTKPLGGLSPEKSVSHEKAPTSETTETYSVVHHAEGSQAEPSALTVEDEGPSFAHLPPQSRAAVIREVKLLFDRIVHDRRESSCPPTDSLPFSDRKFKNVEITTRLMASYLSIFYKHAPLDAAQELFWKSFEEVGLKRSPRIYVEALERCANARRGTDREVALRFADELWVKWKEVEGVEADGRAPSSRLVERAHAAMIRVLAINEHLTRAVENLRVFAAKYPPNSLRVIPPKLPLQSTRTSLVGSRPLVRMTSAADVPDDHVPPLLTFRDLEVLHHRLIDEGRSKDIKYVTWLCKAYEWALRVRRDETIKAKPVGHNTSIMVE